MRPYYENQHTTIFNGDCLDVLRQLPDESVQCCVTSPPYYALRNYNVDGQIGLESSPAEYVARLVDVFREVRRVLRANATLWLNLGDSYAGGTRGRNDFETMPRPRGGHNKSPQNPIQNTVPAGLKPKDMIGIPWRVAFALQEDGWWLRQDLIWAKPNPMPESVTDRCTKAHEYIFLLSKSERYYFDQEAVNEPIAESTLRIHTSPNVRARGTGGDWKQDSVGNGHGGLINGNIRNGKRNRRSVWTVATQPYAGAHFACFPPALIEPCILAGCPEGGTVLDPFGGSGTTAQVATEHNRKSILIELNPNYCDLAIDRNRDVVPKMALFVEAKAQAKAAGVAQESLFGE